MTVHFHSYILVHLIIEQKHAAATAAACFSLTRLYK